MVPLTALWLPIVLSAVIVFVASSIMHMVLPYHKSDYHPLPNEDNARAALRGLRPGLYMMPFCSHEKMKSPEIQAKFQEGPVGHLTILPSGPPNMPAYLAGRTLAPGTHYLQVFRVAGTAAFMAYGLGNLSYAIWKGMPIGVVMKEVFDGLVFGLLTGGTFGWLWPR